MNAAIDFDLQKAVNVANSFIDSCFVGCKIIANDGETLFEREECEFGCNFCERLRELTGADKKCPMTHIYGSKQSERFGGKYIYFCATGLAFFASPITVGGVMKGAFIGGPVLIVDKEEYILHDILEKNGIPESYYDEFAAYFKNAVTVSPERLSHLSNLLFVISSHISSMEHIALAQVEEHYHQQAQINDYIQSIKTSSETQPYPIDKERELLSAISEGDKATAQRLLNEILGHVFFSSGGQFDVVKTRALELMVMLSRAAVEGGADVEQIFGLNYRSLIEVETLKSIEELSYWLAKIMKRFTSAVFNLTDVKHIDVIYKAVDYIKRNYQNHISLEEVASHVFLSPSYFSKIFKDEMKENFSFYLNRVRINKAKSLLLSTHENIVDICEMVGFEDQSYFSKMFKKLSGVTPGKFRESRGQLKFIVK